MLKGSGSMNPGKKVGLKKFSTNLPFCGKNEKENVASVPDLSWQID